MWKPKSLIIIDPGLNDIGGHYYTQDIAIANEAIRLNIPVTIYCRKNAKFVNSTIKIIDLIRFDIFAEIEVGALEFSAFENFFVVNQVFFEDLKNIPTNDFSCDDLIYFPSIVQNQIEGVTDWVTSIDKDKRPYIALTLRVLNSRMEYNTNRGLTTSIEFLYRCSIWKLIQRHPRTKLFSDTLPIALFYKNITGFSVNTLPIPQSPFNNQISIPTYDKTEFNILYIGNISPYRGHVFIPYIIDKILSKFKNVNFTIQIQADVDSDTANEMTAVNENYKKRIKFLFGTLSSKDYLDTLNDADIVLLPYMPSYYSHGSSGVFTEAAALGKVIVVTSETVMEQVANTFSLGVVLSTGYTADEFVSALSTAVLKFDEIYLKAQKSRNDFAFANSPETFLKLMFANISGDNI